MPKSRISLIGALAALACFLCVPSPAQTVADPSSDDTILKQIIIFGRHGVRSAAAPASTLAAFAVRPYPDFGVPAGYLTPHGRTAETLLGTYFRDYLLEEHLLSGNDGADAKHSYFRANSIQRSNISAEALASALFPSATPAVHSYALGQADPIFDPIAAQIVSVDSASAVKELSGIYSSGQSIASAYSGELSLIRSVLLDYSNGTEPPPLPPAGLVDATVLPIPLTANTTIATANVINTGAIGDTLLAADPFVMEYTDGLPLNEVAWGELSLDQISQQTRIITLDFNLEIDSPYLNQVQSSNAAAHILRSMEQEVYGREIPGAFSGPHTRLLVINSSDAYVQGVANLLHMHWLLPGYQPDYCAPGGSLVFELRESRTTGEHVVRAYYTAQTFDQLRNLTPLTLDQPPATMQLLIPGGSKSDTSLDVNFGRFSALLKNAIDLKDVQDPATEVPPGPLTGVPLN